MAILHIKKMSRAEMYASKDSPRTFFTFNQNEPLIGKFTCKDGKALVKLEDCIFYIKMNDVICKPLKSIFEFKSYRSFLKTYRKQQGISFSTMCAFLGMQSNSFVIEVLQGKKKLSVSLTHTIATKMGLSFEEHSYFVAMVGMKDAKTKEARAFYKKLAISSNKP